jgi:hypothetical protein
MEPRSVCASHPFLRSSVLTLSGHEPPKTTFFLLNIGRTRSRYPLLAGKSRFFGVSSAGSLLVVCVPINLDKSSCPSELVCPSSAQHSDNRYFSARMSSVSDALPSTSRINASDAVFHFFKTFVHP